MGKLSQQQLPVVQQQQGRTDGGSVSSGTFCCRRCSRIIKEFNCKCAIVLLLSVAVFIYGLFSFHLHPKKIGFDAKDSIKLSATVQAYFRLQKPVAQLIPHIDELEYGIFGEIGVPSTKVAILSLRQADVSNITDVVFGVLSDPFNASINPVFLSVLKSSFAELFLQQSNLTLNNMTFGMPSSFEILKFPGGITLIPELSPSIWNIPQILFKFVLNNSIDEIKQNFVELKTQLKLGLDLLPDEILYIQVTNKKGSTRDHPVIVESSITSNTGFLLPQRMKQLAQILTGPSAKNLGLDMVVFGKVKEVRLSSFLKRSLHALPPSPSPSPSPSPVSDPPASVSNFHHLVPCSNCDTYAPSDSSHANAPRPENYHHHSSPKMPSSPAPSPLKNSPNCDSGLSPRPSPISHNYPPSPNLSPSACSISSACPIAQMFPAPPLPVVSYGSDHGWDNENGRGLVSPPHVLPSISASSSR